MVTIETQSYVLLVNGSCKNSKQGDKKCSSGDFVKNHLRIILVYTAIVDIFMFFLLLSHLPGVLINIEGILYYENITMTSSYFWLDCIILTSKLTEPLWSVSNALNRKCAYVEASIKRKKYTKSNIIRDHLTSKVAPSDNKKIVQSLIITFFSSYLCSFKENKLL